MRNVVCHSRFLIVREFVAFVLLTNVLFRPIDKINAIIEMYPRGIAGFKSYMELMETEPDIQDSPDASRFRPEGQYPL